MARKRKVRQDDPNQLMLFSFEEMSGESELSDLSDGTERADPSSQPETRDPRDTRDPRNTRDPRDTRNTRDTSDPSNPSNPSDPRNPRKTSNPSDDIKQAPSADGLELMSKVIGLLDGLSPSVIRLVAMQSTALVQGGVDQLEQYCIPSLPGMVFRGDALERIAYVSLARSFPHMMDKLGLDFSAEYEEAE